MEMEISGECPLSIVDKCLPYGSIALNFHVCFSITTESQAKLLLNKKFSTTVSFGDFGKVSFVVDDDLAHEPVA